MPVSDLIKIKDNKIRILQNTQDAEIQNKCKSRDEPAFTIILFLCKEQTRIPGRNRGSHEKHDEAGTICNIINVTGCKQPAPLIFSRDQIVYHDPEKYKYNKYERVKAHV